MLHVIKYRKEFKYCWDRFIYESKNGSFLFYRDFMEYHIQRFNDFSLLVFDDTKMIALIPANLNYNKIISHQGLSYGGIILSDELRLVEVIEVVKVVLLFLKEQNIDIWQLKCIPRIYHTRPADEIDWIMFRLKARLYRRDTSMAIASNSDYISFQDRRKRAIKRAKNLKIQLKEGYEEFKPFWNEVLIPNLLAKHSIAPVHTIDEIELLANRFPDNIKQHSIYLDNKIVAGCTMFLNKKVAHAQYISGTEEGREKGCLDYLFEYLIKHEYASFAYFDFGICNEQEGSIINKGLLDWKEGFGARTIIHDFYEIDTISYSLLNNYTI